MKIKVIVCAMICSAFGIVCGAEKGFEPLLGPGGISAWRISDWSDLRTPQKVAGEAWKLEDGVLYGLGKRTWIISPLQYSDFVLKLETKITRGSNGGIGLRFPPAGDPAYTGMEIQVVDHEVYYRGRSMPQQRTGSIYDEVAPEGADINGPGQWNSWRITCKDKHVEIVINGVKAVDVDMAEHTMPRQSKGPALAKRPVKGHIGFQNLSGLIEMRNIEIKDLTDRSDEFEGLFNGMDLDGWVNVNCAPETWRVQDGMIICSGIPTGVMRTERMYENYVLELEYRHMKPGGNAGLFLHSDPITAPGQPFTRSIEVQILDGRNSENYTSHGDVFAIHGAKLRPHTPHPGGWMRALPAERRSKPAGQWNHYKVVSNNGDIELAVNGKVVTRAHDAVPRKGYICLESEGGIVHYRNINIRELPSTDPPAEMVAEGAEGFRPIYNGLDLRGWKVPQGSEGHWSARNWILDYDGKSEADDKHLWTKEEFEDFVLIVDWRQPREPKPQRVPVIKPDGSQKLDEQGRPVTAEVMDAGDSGIYLRGSSKSQINIWNWPVGSGEIWGYRTDRNMPADVRRAATPSVNADNKPGSWNRFRITVVGRTVTVVLNGRTVIENAELPGMPVKGPIALQHHGDPIQFANIYIKEL